MKNTSRNKKLNFAALAKSREQVDDNGRHGRCGNWYMGLGGHDMGYEIYYRGEPIGRVNYGDREYELYDEDFIPKEQIPEFLAAIDARKFKDVGHHEQDDEDDIVGEEVDIGWDLEAMRDDAARRSRERDARDKLDEKKIVFNDREMRKKYAKHLISNAQRDDVISLDRYKELLSAFDQAKPGDRFDIPEMEKYLKGWFVQAYAESRKVNEARKQIMWAVNVRNMHTAIHGLYYGKDKRRVQKFAREMGRLTEIEGEYDPEEIDNVWDDFFAEYPDIQTIEEFNYRDIVDLPGGYEGVEIGDTIYKFVNRTSIDLYYESTRNQKMKFKKIVKESVDEMTPEEYAEAGQICRSLLREIGADDSQNSIFDIIENANRVDPNEIEINGSRFERIEDGKVVVYDYPQPNHERHIDPQDVDWIRVEGYNDGNIRADILYVYLHLNKSKSMIDQNNIQFDYYPDPNSDDYADSVEYSTCREYMTNGMVNEAEEGGYASDHPRIYVGTYAKYNDGSIDGKWIDISEAA